MHRQVTREDLELSSRVQFYFALGKAAEEYGRLCGVIRSL